MTITDARSRRAPPRWRIRGLSLETVGTTRALDRWARCHAEVVGGDVFRGDMPSDRLVDSAELVGAMDATAAGMVRVCSSAGGGAKQMPHGG